MKKILSNYNIPRMPFEQLDDSYALMFPPEGESMFSKEEMLNIIEEFDVLVSMFTIPIDKEIIDAGKKLKLITNFGVGYNNIDFRYAREKGITVCNTPKAVCNPTAEMAVALMLAVNRRIAELDRVLRSRKVRKSVWGVMDYLGNTLEYKTLGIIGMGNIGKRVAEIGGAFGMKVVYYNRSKIVPEYCRVELDELLQISDIVSLHCPLTSETRHLISKRELDLMKTTSVLINTARGAVVDEKALVEALKIGKIRAAGLDVFEDEPLISEKLYKMNNVVLLPHKGSGTMECRINTSTETVENILAFYDGNPKNIIN
jgi:lactate dehydrogenase-like 2-hydroxyacid dehydrogenase